MQLSVELGLCNCTKKSLFFDGILINDGFKSVRNQNCQNWTSLHRETRQNIGDTIDWLCDEFNYSKISKVASLLPQRFSDPLLSIVLRVASPPLKLMTFFIILISAHPPT